MKNILFPLILLIMLTSCSRPTQTEQELRNTVNQPLHLGMFDTVRQGNNLLPYAVFRQQHPYLSVVYLENGCGPCYPKFIDWQNKMETLAAGHNHSVLFVIKGHSYEEFMRQVRMIEDIDNRYCVIMDPNYEFIDANSEIPRWIIDASILIDSDNRIKIVGAPWLNKEMEELFLKTIYNGQH